MKPPPQSPPAAPNKLLEEIRQYLAGHSNNRAAHLHKNLKDFLAAPTPPPADAVGEPSDSEMLAGGRIPFTEPLTTEELARFPAATHAYWAWVKRVLKTNAKLPLAKVAWDAGVEYANSIRPASPHEPSLGNSDDSNATAFLKSDVPSGWRVLKPAERVAVGDKFFNTIETIGPLGWTDSLSIGHRVDENHLGARYIRRMPAWMKSASPHEGGETPRTDLVFLASMNPVVNAGVALERMENFARTLERELNEANKELNLWRDMNSNAGKMKDGRFSEMT